MKVFLENLASSKGLGKEKHVKEKQILVMLAALFITIVLLGTVACTSAPGPAGPSGPTGPAGPAGPAAPTVPVPSGSGLKLNISKVEINTDSKPVVTFSLTDDKGIRVRPSELDANSLRFTIAKLVPDKETGLSNFDNYIVLDVKGNPYTFNGAQKQPAMPTAKQASSGMDVGGKLTETPDGYTYVFTNTLPANYDRTVTHVVGGQATRNNREAAANGLYAFIPSTGTPAKREVVLTENCNACHDKISGHGGQRYEVGMCQLCHTPQTTDPETGNTVDLKVMIHKLHNGSNLPSVKAKNPYYIVGFGQSVVDFSKATWPQDVRNCTTCHQKGAQADNWKTAPSRAACGSCHDGINWETGKSIVGGADHAGGPQKDDKSCKGCHAADSGQEFDASIVGAHTIPALSKQLKGITMTVESAVLKPGEKPSVDFSIKDKSGAAVDPNTMTSLEITIANPAPDYAARITENPNRIIAPPAAPFVRTGTLTDLGGGKWRYVFSVPLDPAWKGTAAVGMAGYRNATIKANYGKDAVVREGSLNPVIYVSLDGSKPAAQRVIIKRENCNQCHRDLGSPAGFAIHGGTRRSPEYCIMCHNANQTDEPARPKDQMPPESVHWDYMIHSIHMGDERAVPALFSSLRTDSLAYPTAGDQKNCAKCHAAGTYLLPLAKTALPTMITQGNQVIKVIQPVTAACSGCHTTSEAVAHMAQQTSSDKIESCAVCHGAGKEFDVDLVHKK
jgi:OmcA/MtrC family decaheme c-type cytochrome